MTGYPSIDKPWLKYYSEEAINAVPTECSIYRNIYEHNKDFLSDTALLYFGKKISYGKLFQEIDRAAAAFAAHGVGENDNVVILEYIGILIPFESSCIVLLLNAFDRQSTFTNILYSALSMVFVVLVYAINPHKH